MIRSIVKIIAATGLVVGIHSALASRTAKKKASTLLGKRTRNGLYRPVYNGLAIVTFGALALYGCNLPDRELYRVRRPYSWLMRSVQFWFLLYLLRGAREIGFLKFAGFPNLVALATGQSHVPPEPEGQGPILETPDKMKVTGPFRFSRHPLSFGMLPILWLMPRMTMNLAAFNLVATIYLVAGSIHEEKRLIERYGQAYIEYRNSGINFFVPSPTHMIDSQKRLA